MPSLTTVFALAIVAVLVAAIALIALVTLFRELNRVSSTLRNLQSVLDRRTPAALEAAVADLDAAIAKMGKSTRSQFGTIWGTIGAIEESLAAAGPASDGERPTRDQLRVQHLKPPMMGHKE